MIGGCRRKAPRGSRETHPNRMLSTMLPTLFLVCAIYPTSNGNVAGFGNVATQKAIRFPPSITVPNVRDEFPSVCRLRGGIEGGRRPLFTGLEESTNPGFFQILPTFMPYCTSPIHTETDKRAVPDITQHHAHHNSYFKPILRAARTPTDHISDHSRCRTHSCG
jgi:hypothetical protein